MEYDVVINKKTGEQYLVLSEHSVDANNSAEGDELSVVYTDGITLFHRKRTEFFLKTFHFGKVSLPQLKLPQRPFIPEKNHLQV